MNGEQLHRGDEAESSGDLPVPPEDTVELGKCWPTSVRPVMCRFLLFIYLAYDTSTNHHFQPKHIFECLEHP